MSARTTDDSKPLTGETALAHFERHRTRSEVAPPNHHRPGFLRARQQHRRFVLRRVREHAHGSSSLRCGRRYFKRRILVTARKIVHFVIRDTPVSFGRVDRFHNDPCDEAEHTAGVILSDTKDILAKKMFERFSFNQLVSERDAYDFIIARTEDPDALAYAWGTLTDDLRTNAKLAYRERAEGLDVSQYPGRPVENPRYEHIARDLWAHASRMLDSDLAHATALHPRDGDTGHGGGGHGR